MEYENIDENAKYQEACRKVKQIADAIEKIIMKNYINWKNISPEDKQKYDELKLQMTQIAQDNGLDNLRIELINEIKDKYTGKIPEIDGKVNSPKNKEELIQKIVEQYKGATNVEKQALEDYEKDTSKENVEHLIATQNQAKKIKNILEQYGEKGVEIALEYRRRLFEELGQVKQTVTDWPKTLKTFARENNVQKMQEFRQDLENEIRGKGNEKAMFSNELVME